MEPAVLRTDRAAEFLGLAVATLKKMRAARTGPAYEKHGRLVYYRLDDLRAWQEKQVTERVRRAS